MTAAVAVSGFFEQESGMGAMARSLGAVLDAAGEPWTAHRRRSGEGSARQRHPYPPRSADAEPDVLVVCENADSLPVSLASGVFGDLAALPTVGYWAWEVDSVPSAYADVAGGLAEVWTLSAFAAVAIGRHVDVPVHAIPPVVEVPTRIDRDAVRARLGVADRFVVAFVYDALSGVPRKNPAAVVDAYCRAFTPRDGCTLLLKVANADRHPGHADELREWARRPDVVVHDGYLDPAEHARVVHAADAYLSLHHAEGFGFTLAEAMAAGVPVLATGWSGNLEFMDAVNSFPVRSDLVPVPDGASPLYPVGACWAEPDDDHAVHLLRAVRDDPANAARVGARGRATIAALHAPRARAARVRARVQEVRAGRSDAARTAAELDELARLVVEPFDASGPARAGTAARWWRTGVLRALRHHDEQERDRLRRIVEAMRSTEDRRHAAGRRAEHARALAVAEAAYEAQVARAAGGPTVEPAPWP